MQPHSAFLDYCLWLHAKITVILLTGDLNSYIQSSVHSWQDKDVNELAQELAGRLGLKTRKPYVSTKVGFVFRGVFSLASVREDAVKGETWMNSDVNHT